MAEAHYQVLARKWRPQRFEQVVGQAAVVRTLSNALDQGRIAHAYCFSGIRGVGKTTIARLLAKGLNCRNAEAPTSEPCGECEACLEIEGSRSLDVIEMDAASQTGVDDIRQLNEFARYTPSRDRYRVFIIDEAHMLSTAAFNALLKTLEEPPPHVVFQLATTEPRKIPQTVLSRCQHYPLGRISQAEISGRLREIIEAEGVKISDDGLAQVAMAADGSLRDAQSLLDKLIAFAGDEIDNETIVELLGMVDRELLFSVTTLIAEGNLTGVLDFVNRLVEQGIDLHQFTLDLLGHLRALLVVRTVKEPGSILHLPEADLALLSEQAALFEVEDLDRAFALLSSSEYRIKSSEVPRYHLEMVLGRLARLPTLEPIETLLSELRGGGSGSSPSSGGTRGSSGGGSASRDSAGRAPAAAEQDAAAARPGASGVAPGVRSGRPITAPPEARTDPAPAEARTDAIGDEGPPEAGVDADSPIALIRQRLRAKNPVIAKVLDRAETIEMREDTLWLSFPADGSIFKERLRDRKALAAIEEAAQEALGRSIRVMAGFQAAQPETRAVEPQTPQTADPDEVKRRELWKRAEEEAMVQQFIEALQGHITEVREPK